MTEDLGGRLAVVTGASSGIGRAIAFALAAQGVGILLIGRRAAALDATAAELERAGGGGGGGRGAAWTWPLDLSGEIDADALRNRLRMEADGLDVLVHCAGTHVAGAVATAPVAEFDEQYRVNVRGPYVLTQALLPMLRARRGQIVFVNSSAGLHARGGIGGYAASKHALRALADAVRDEVNADGIRVLSVYPGRTATPQQAAIHAEEGKRYQPERLIQPEDVASVVVHALGMPRTAEVTDISIRPMQKS
jgi:NADP-dependent 3-hydroxy acid dehydrogenase YdfG